MRAWQEADNLEARQWTLTEKKYYIRVLGKLASSEKKDGSVCLVTGKQLNF